MRPATAGDVRLLVEMMTEFYAESDFPLNAERAAMAFEALLADPRLGRAWILEAGARPAGYAVLTLGYSMEYGGRDAFLDDLYVRREHRGSGLGTRAVAGIRGTCEDLGVRALHLEVDRGNARALGLYRRAGFTDNDRQLLTLKLGDPLHIG